MPLVTVVTDVDYDRNANFGAYKTYGWAPLPKTQTLANAATDQAIRAAVDEEMKSKGLKKVAASPDVYVIYHVSSEQTPGTRNYTDWGYGNAYQSGYGYYTGWPGRPATYAVLEQQKTGALVLDVVERRRQQLVWRGVRPGVVGAKEQKPETARRAVLSLLTKFPPAATGAR